MSGLEAMRERDEETIKLNRDKQVSLRWTRCVRNAGRILDWALRCLVPAVHATLDWDVIDSTPQIV